MNTHAEYRRHSYRPPEPPEPAPVPNTKAGASTLARHGDPSSLPATEAQAPPKAPKGIAWVRPTELASYVTPMVGRGIDLHAELIRRARRTRVTTRRALQRGVPSPAPTPAAHRTEGLSL
ncbi:MULTISPECIES: hypothetical protein [Nocardioides]|uniref:Uncharacterized protein n=1 Tax=Nocardioides vastitatis TaxID=2568655 RepID=A0ABW0ZN87_9ACTN|nr:hypothetical protein [Nocardioides sp.]THI92785.1 hypothetical protein E7Z54_21600 [Nocardioides sp.]